MKRLFVIFILIAFAGVVAFASLNSKSQKTDVQKTEVKKTEKKDIKKKKECKRTCWLST